MVRWLGEPNDIPFDDMNGVSFDALGIQRADFAPGGQFHALTYQGQAVASLIATAAAGAATGATDRRVRGNWQWSSVREQVSPIAELVSDRIARSDYSMRAAAIDDVVGSALDVLSEIPYNAGPEYQVHYPFDELPPWFDVSAVSDDELVDFDGNIRTRQLVSEFIIRDLTRLEEQLNLVDHVIDLQLQAYIHGDGFAYRLDRIVDPTYESDFSRVHTDNGVVELQGLNPTAVTITPDPTGVVREVVLRGPGGAQPEVLDQDHVLRMKNLGSTFSTYGVPQTVRAFTDLHVKETYLTAAAAWAQRYALPVRMLRYGALVRAGNNAGVVASPEMKSAAEITISQYDPSRGQTIVAPFHWDLKFVGAEETSAMTISNEVAESNRRILGAIGLPSAFITADWTNYATARMQYMQLLHRLRGRQKRMTKTIRQQVIVQHMRLRGYVDPNGDLIEVTMRWRRGYLADDQSMHDLVGELAKNADEPTLSLRSLREMLGYDNQQEEENLDQEAEDRLRRAKVWQSVDPQNQLGPPGTDPNQADENGDEDAEDEETQAVARLRTGLRLARRQVALASREGRAAVAGATSFAPHQQRVVQRIAVRRVLNARRIEQAYAKRLTERSDPTVVSAAIMLRIPLEIGTRYAGLLGTTRVEDMHVTLAYIPTMVYSPDVIADLRIRVQEFCRSCRPLTLVPGGVGRFHPGEDQLQPVWLSIESPPLVEAQQRLIQALSPEFVTPDRPYRPHVTLDWVTRGAAVEYGPVPRVEPFACTQVRLSIRAGETQLVEEDYTCGG